MQKPSQSEIQKQTNAAIQDYVNTDLAAVITKARNSGDTNRLGLAYVKAGRFADAKAEFTKGANAGKLSSIISNTLSKSSGTKSLIIYVTSGKS